MYGPKHLVFQLSRGLGLLICNDPNIQFFNFLEEGTSYMYGPKHLVFQLFRKVGTRICMDLSIQFSIVRQSGNPNFAMYGPNHLVFQLFGRVGTSLCIDPAIQFFNCLGEWELGYVWTEAFSLSIVRQGEGEIGYTAREYIQTFSFSIVSWSVNLDMYGPTHLVFQLSRGM